VDTLTPEARARWVDPTEQDRMVEDAMRAAGAEVRTTARASSIPHSVPDAAPGGPS